MGITRTITDQWRRLTGPAKGKGKGNLLAEQVVAMWKEVTTGPVESMSALPASLLRRMTDLENKRQASGDLPDLALTHDLLVCAREVMSERLAGRVRRPSAVTDSSRSWQRTATAHELKVAQLQDEIVRCRDLIAQECRRRSLQIPQGSDESDLRDDLFALMQNISRSQSRRMQTVKQDPLLVELLRLLDAKDAADLEKFPAWLRAPAERLVKLVAERNRYRKLLQARGLLLD